MSGSRTTIADEGRLDNVHPGDILREDFRIGSEIPVGEVAADAGIDAEKLQKLVASQISVDADTDLRLARYLRMSEGFFLGLQIDFDIEEAKRALNGDLDRIVPRAA
ncbi:MAG: addiction module antidote protein, HigA family [Sphingomonadales bacterium]|nr:MAG: addiction module antidote protein, HigA family [Sphingomonadales bacterium]